MTANTDDRLRALGEQLVERLEAKGFIVPRPIDLQRLRRLARMEQLAQSRLAELRAQEAPREPGNVIPAAHRFRPMPDLGEAHEEMVRRHNPGMSEAEIQARLRRDAELLREAARAIRGLPPLDGEPAA